MLLGNRSLFQKNAMTYRNGTATAGAYSANVVNNLTQSGRNRNVYVNAEVQSYSRANAVPTGYTHPYNWIMPQNNGGMASFKYLSGLVSFAGDGAGGLNAVASIAGAIALTNADMGLIVSAIAALSASISTTNAELAAVLDMVANTISASGTLNAPTLGALAGLLAGLSAQATLSSGSLVDSPGFMASSIGGATPLSPEGLAASLLDTNEIETGYSLRESLRLILSALAGKVSGAGTTTISIRDVNDAVDRIVATVDTNGNRTNVVKDVA
jgi:hypothetical protein